MLTPARAATPVSVSPGWMTYGRVGGGAATALGAVPGTVRVAPAISSAVGLRWLRRASWLVLTPARAARPLSVSPGRTA